VSVAAARRLIPPATQAGYTRRPRKVRHSPTNRTTACQWESSFSLTSRGYGDSRGDSHGYGYGDCDESPWACGLWRFSNGYEIKRKRVKHAINVVVAVWISSNAVQFVICFTGIFFFIVITKYKQNTVTCTNTYICSYSIHNKQQKYAANEKTQAVVAYGIEDSGFCEYEESVEIPTLFCGYGMINGDWNPERRFWATAAMSVTHVVLHKHNGRYCVDYLLLKWWRLTV